MKDWNTPNNLHFITIIRNLGATDRLINPRIESPTRSSFRGLSMYVTQTQKPSRLKTILHVHSFSARSRFIFKAVHSPRVSAFPPSPSPLNAPSFPAFTLGEHLSMLERHEVEVPVTATRPFLPSEMHVQRVLP
jgi:hypothetical protein